MLVFKVTYQLKTKLKTNKYITYVKVLGNIFKILWI